MGFEKGKKMKKEKKELLKFVFYKTVPVMTGYLFLGAAYGVLMSVSGFSPWWAIAMSVFVYAGSLQYVGVNLLTAAASPFTAFLMGLMINARHIFYGISMLDKYSKAGKEKPYLIAGLTDETFSVVCSLEVPKNQSASHVYFLITLVNHLYWIVGTAAGAFLGEFVPFDTTGIDFALTALFTVIFVDQWKSTKDHRGAVLGVLATALCLLIFGSEIFIPVSMGVIVVVCIVFYFVKGKREVGEAKDENE